MSRRLPGFSRLVVVSLPQRVALAAATIALVCGLCRCRGRMQINPGADWFESENQESLSLSLSLALCAPGISALVDRRSTLDRHCSPASLCDIFVLTTIEWLAAAGQRETRRQQQVVWFQVDLVKK